VPYRGFGKQGSVYVSGHVFRGYGIKPPERGSVMKNFYQMIKRYSLKASADLPLTIQIFDRRFNVVTDKNGFFSGTFSVETGKPGTYTYSVAARDGSGVVQSDLHIYTESETGVLSDIDDTILLSHVNQKYKMLWLLIAKNALTRNPVPQINGIFNAIKHYNQETLPSDFFYVSNSEWNLYDFLTDFFQENRLPNGVFMLQRFKHNFRDAVFTPQKKDDHKFESIRFILDFFTRKKFILLGDNGQRDLEIYSAICKQYASRIKAVIIRDIGKRKYRRKNKVFEDRILDLDIPEDHIDMKTR
jgi:phosphatidate phosphatase APP1